VAVADRTTLGNIVFAPYSAVGWLATLGWMCLLSATTLPMLAFRRFESFQIKWPHPQISWPLWFIGCPLKVDRDPKYDKKKVSVFMLNHTSMLDASIACGSIQVPLCGLENAAHLKVPGYGWVLTMANAIPVRKGARRYEEIAEAFNERRSRGISVLAFPEAHRTMDGKVRPFKRGVFHIAVEAGIPITPMAVRGAYEMLPKGTWIHRPTKLHVYMAPQIETKDLTTDQVPQLMERVHEVVRAWVEDGVKKPELCLEPIPKVAPESDAAAQ